MRIIMNIKDWIESGRAWFWRILRKILRFYVRCRFYRYQYWRRIEVDLLDEVIEQMPKKYYDLAEEELARVRTWKEIGDEEIERFTDHAIWDVPIEGESWIERYARESGSCHSRKERYVIDKLKCAGLSLFRVEKRVDCFGAFVSDLLSLNKSFFLWDPSMADNALPGDLMLMRVIRIGGVRMVANSTAYVFEDASATKIREVFDREVLKPVWSGTALARESVRKQKAFFFRRMMEEGIPYELYPFPGEDEDVEGEDEIGDTEEDAREEPHFHSSREDMCPEDKHTDPSFIRDFFNKPRPYVRASSKTGRNDPCPCGSGKKYKKCCEAMNVS